MVLLWKIGILVSSCREANVAGTSFLADGLSLISKLDSRVDE
jgi:hypothetical protein